MHQGLNEQQRQAVEHGSGPLLIVAGAGSGKTRTLVHRVARLIEQGRDPERLLLLTFTRRASAEMLRRVEGLLRRLRPATERSGQGVVSAGRSVWGGTFHATATRLLRLYGAAIGLDPGFTILDRSDSEDLLDVVRTELDLAKTDQRFPKKGTCLAIYGHAVNSLRPLEEILPAHYPWCQSYVQELKQLFRTYVDRKEESLVLDYDDLLLFWQGLMRDPVGGQRVRERFDAVLVDEYQDTNRLQADILQGLCPDGAGLTVVGDDAQSIYSFRAATIRNILDFPTTFPGTTVIKLEQNYRSTAAILNLTNQVIAETTERYAKSLWSDRDTGPRPLLVTCADEDEQAEFLIREILKHRESGLQLREQAVLFRTSHHSMVLEAELSRHNIPFVKYGGLKFMETAHVKDLMAFLRLAENPRDLMAGTRVLMLLPGIGPRRARQLLNELLERLSDFSAWLQSHVPEETRAVWPRLVQLMAQLGSISDRELPAQVELVRLFYEPLLEDRYENVEPRRRDLEQLQRLVARFPDRRSMLAEITLDPPASTEDFAGDPLLDEDYLILSTIHSAKGLEWKAVYTIHASDGNIPSDMSCGSPELIEEERRLFYVALTRAQDRLYVCFPQRYYHVPRGPRADRHGFAQLTRFITPRVATCLECQVARVPEIGEPPAAPPIRPADIRNQIKALWT